MLSLTPSRLVAGSCLTGCIATLLVAITSTAGGCAKGSELGDGLEGGVLVGVPGSSSSGSGGVIIVGGSSSSTTTTSSTTTATSSSTVSTSTSSSGTCVNGEMMCSAGCTDVTQDPNNCGFCGNSCNGSTCVGSQCASSSSGCSGGETLCDGECTDTTSDPDNCGFCENFCESGSCTGSVCDSDDAGGGGFDAGGGGCAHSPCTVGAALEDGCDDDADELVSSICEGDQPQCCTSGWSQSCVDEATEDCGTGSGFDFCEDPGC